MRSTVARTRIATGGTLRRDSSPQVETAPEDLKDVWNDRYADEQYIWGFDPGPAALTLVEALAKEPGIENSAVEIFEFGCGYGRSAFYFAEHGFHVTGIDASAVGISLAQSELQRRAINTSKLTEVPAGEEGSLAFLKGSLELCSRWDDGSFDAVFSHRALHLLGHNQVHALAKEAARLTRPGGILCICARSLKDFDPQQMRWIKEGETAEYKKEYINRPGHILHFWNEEQYKETFGKYFKIETFYDHEEGEAISNPGVVTKLLTVVARK